MPPCPASVVFLQNLRKITLKADAFIKGDSNKPVRVFTRGEEESPSDLGTEGHEGREKHHPRRGKQITDRKVQMTLKRQVVRAQFRFGFVDSIVMIKL